MSWEDVENAMQFAVAKASGFASDRVFWNYQNVNAPELDYISIAFGGESVVGIDRMDISINLARQAGQEVKQEVKGVREVPFELEVFTETTFGDTAARRIAELTRTRMRLPDVRYALRKVGLVPFDTGPVNYVPDIPSANFRGRATCTIQCYVPVTDCIEYVGYIATVRGFIYPSGYRASMSPSGIAFSYAV